MIVFISQASWFLLPQCVLNANTMPYIQLLPRELIIFLTLAWFIIVQSERTLRAVGPAWVGGFQKGKSRCFSVLRQSGVKSD